MKHSHNTPDTDTTLSKLLANFRKGMGADTQAELARNIESMKLEIRELRAEINAIRAEIKAIDDERSAQQVLLVTELCGVRGERKAIDQLIRANVNIFRDARLARETSERLASELDEAKKKIQALESENIELKKRVGTDVSALQSSGLFTTPQITSQPPKNGNEVVPKS